MADRGASQGTEPERAGRRGLTRRGFIGAIGATAAAAAGGVAAGAEVIGSGHGSTQAGQGAVSEPFYGPHQGGIATPLQRNTYFAAFDVTAESRTELAELLRSWTDIAYRLTLGLSPSTGPAGEPDSDETVGLGPSRLTVNVGFGPSLFVKDGTDRFGLGAGRPAALVDLPAFSVDQLVESKTGGDLVVQACADDPQVVFHAVRQLARAAAGAAAVRWVESGSNEGPVSGGTPRNLIGFKDGTVNPRSAASMAEFVWAGAEAPEWMRNGTYAVVRRIRVTVEHWDAQPLTVQERTIGRHKLSGAPLGRAHEFDPLDLEATEPDGRPLIPLDAHVRMASPQENDGRMILRRSYTYNDGVDPFVEDWAPWQEAVMFDAGLLFVAYQRDPRRGFIPIFEHLASGDALGAFTAHTGSAIAAMPGGVAGPGHWIGEGLFA